MKKLMLSFSALAAATSLALAGTEYSGKEMKQSTAVQQECWYGDNEWNVNVWGTYVFTGSEMNSLGAPGFFLGEPRGDNYLQGDHAWGGGGDVKYFWHKYFGFGVEGFALDAKRT